MLYVQIDTRDIWKVTCSELLTKQALRKKNIIYRTELHKKWCVSMAQIFLHCYIFWEKEVLLDGAQLF
jgi:hypothetical protein